MNALRRGVLAAERAVSAATLTLASLLLMGSLGLGMFQIATRFFLHRPSSWTETAIETLMVWIGFLGLAAAFRQGAVAGFDVVERSLGRTGRRWLARAIALCTLSLLGCLVWFGAALVWRVRFQTLAGLEISIGFAYAAVPVGAALAWLAVLACWVEKE